MKRRGSIRCPICGKYSDANNIQSETIGYFFFECMHHVNEAICEREQLFFQIWLTENGGENLKKFSEGMLKDMGIPYEKTD